MIKANYKKKVKNPSFNNLIKIATIACDNNDVFQFSCNEKRVFVTCNKQLSDCLRMIVKRKLKQHVCVKDNDK